MFVRSTICMSRFADAIFATAGTLLLATALTGPVVWAQGDNGTVEGVVRDAQKRPLAKVKISLDDQVEGRSTSTISDAAGHFRFNGVAASTYLVREKKSGYLDATEGPFVVKAGKTVSLNLQMADENGTARTKDALQGLAYSDEPKFTVAGVTDPSNVGGHGSNVTLPTKEALAKETAALAADGSKTSRAENAKEISGELPKVPTDDFVGNLKEGKELLQAGRGKDAVAYLERAAQLRPQDYDAAYFLALAYLKNGDAKRAEQLVRALLARQDRANLHALLAEAKEAEGQPVEAVKEYQRAAEMEPSEEHLFSWGAELLLHHADEPAAEVFAKGHRLYPTSIRILVGLGATAYAQDLNEQAARWLLQAIDLDPSDPRPYWFLGKVQEVAKSEPKEWAAAFERFAALQPDNARAHYYFAVALEKQKRGPQDFAAREAQLKKAIALDPQFGEAYLRWGMLQAERGEFAKAVELLQKAVQYTPLPDEAHLRLAQVYRQMGKPEKARKESELYNEVSEKKKEQLERERRELGQFVYTMQGEAAPGGNVAPKR